MTRAKKVAAKDETPPVGPADAPPVPSPPSPPAWQHIQEGATERAVRGAGLAIAILLFAVAAIIALYNVMRIASIWFEPRFVPIVQFILASAIMLGCYAALRRLKR